MTGKNSQGDKAYRDYKRLVDRETAQRAPGARQYPTTTTVSPAPSRNGKRPATRKVAQPKPPARPRKPLKSQPGARQALPKRTGQGAK